ncbi:phosphatase PAP2-related protein [Mucilaginibacter myungsuensis]|uniref:phosphatase PAP2-related protein n=1 Tax=Mucilaginibacter myungsuensis TaxID=649104 RepID=UPI0025B380AA|nr:phosphatase PAP2-related protein [Mucilaginibacter myungsuensis]MDN3599108.1 phosphatase PAP2-related protein [Mucilaginibacter myungsuensis]
MNTIGRKESWKSFLSSSVARFELIGGSVLVAILLGAMPFFFNSIEKRPGIRLNDWVLDQIPAHNVSFLIFAIIWGMGALALVRAAKRPGMYVTFVWAYSFIILVRFCTISMIKLDPPAGLINLVDPITGLFYGGNVITKDLFFSGHTATLFLIFLTLQKKTDRIIGLIAVIAVGILLLVQHVHYTLDVIVAPIAVYPIFKLVKAMLGDHSPANERK